MGPKIQFGGLNDGFTRVAYHELIAGVVNKDPINPAASGNIKETINFICFESIFLVLKFSTLSFSRP